MNGLSLSHTVLANVDAIRTARGLSVPQLADAAGITKQYLYLLRSAHGGERAISFEILARLAIALNVHPCDLLREPEAR